VTITVFGAGAIGGITGAALARAGHDVLLVDKAEDHVAAINTGGLTIEGRDGAYSVRVRAITPDTLGPGLDLVLLAVKSQDTPAALKVLVPRLAESGAIVSMQNGLNEELIAAAVGERRTVGCLVNWAADWTAPGRILHGGDGALVRGELAGRLRAMTVIASHYRAHTKTKTGIWRDLAVRRRKTEVGALLGATVTKATRLGLAMPLTERLIAMIADLEAGRRVMTWDNVDELVRNR